MLKWLDVLRNMSTGSDWLIWIDKPSPLLFLKFVPFCTKINRGSVEGFLHPILARSMEWFSRQVVILINRRGGENGDAEYHRRL